MSEDEIIDFLDWMSERFRPEGLGVWSDCENDEESYTSQEVLDLYNDNN